MKERILREISKNIDLLADEFSEPTKPTEPITEPKPTNPTPIQPEEDLVELMVLFYGMDHAYIDPVDIRINDGEWITDYNLKTVIGNAKGELLKVPYPIRKVEIRQSQIRFSGLNNDGYGWFNYKIGAKPPKAKLTTMNHNTNSPDYWAGWVRHHADHVGRHNALSTGRPHPQFYVYDVPELWNATRKMALMISAVGLNHPEL